MKDLSKFEKRIEEELEREEWVRAKDHGVLRKELEAGAKALMKKKPVSIRLSERDLMLLKRKSLETGIPYQTLIATLVRQYVEGKIKLEV